MGGGLHRWWVGWQAILNHSVGPGKNLVPEFPHAQCGHRRLLCGAGEEGCRSAASAGMDWVAITARGPAKLPWGRRKSPLPHTQLLTSVKYPSREQRNKQQKTGRGAKRGRGRQRVVKFSQKPEPKPDPLPDSQEEAEPGPAKLALSELEHQEELPVLTIQDLASVMEPEAVEKELAAGIQDPAGELPESRWPRGGSGDTAVLPHEDCQPRLPTL